MAEGRIAIFGDGSLDLNTTHRDGSIGDRRELLHGLRAWGVDAVYLSHERFNAGGLAAGWGWRGNLDALVVETRGAQFPPNSDPEKHVFHAQAAVLRDWHEGRFGTDVPLLLVDFDLNVRKVFGLAGRTSDYVSSAAWRNLTPWMPEVLGRVAREATVLAPYEPSLAPITLKRQPGEAYRVERWVWPYPTELEVRPLPWSERQWELTYPGSDYNRREKFWRYYVVGARAGCRVAVTGVWNDRRKGSEPGWDQPGFRGRVEAEAGERLHFAANGRNGIPYEDVQQILRRTKAVVQIVPNVSEMPYERIGYYTVRIAETAAAGAVPFVDRDIAAHEEIVPRDWFRVSSFEDLKAKMVELRGRELEAVDEWRAHLRVIGAGVERAAHLLELAGCD